jgi:hypothetical protein
MEGLGVTASTSKLDSSVTICVRCALLEHPADIDHDVVITKRELH